MQASICAGVSRKLSGDQASNFCEYSRTATSPRCSMSARMPSTVTRTCAWLLALVWADWPLLMTWIM
ncbi:hypothetical protein D9M70_408260 [compost metagenome]